MRRPLSVLLVHLGGRDGGAERQTAALASGLVRRGHRSIILIRSGSPLERRAHEAAAPVFPLQAGFPRGPGGILTWWSLRRSREILRNGSWDLLHFADAASHALAGALLGRPAGGASAPRVLVTYRGAAAKRAPASLRRHHKAGGAVLTASEALWSALVRDGFDEERLSVVHPGVEIKSFAASADGRERARRELGAGPDDEIVGTTAIMDAERGLEDLIDAFARVARDRPRARLVILGDGPRRGAVEARARRSEASARITLAGWKEDVASNLSALDAYVFSGRGQEVFPLSLVEAMAAGVPVVVKDQPGIREIIENGKQGLFVPGNASEDLSRTIARVLADRGEAGRLGHAGMVRVQRFHTQAMVDATEALYYRLAKVEEAA